MKRIKRYNLIKFIATVMLFALVSCQQAPSNNWSEDDKANVAAVVMITIQTSRIQTLVNDQNIIAEKVLNKCLAKYPNIEDFKKNTSYSGDAFKDIMRDDYNLK